MKKTLSFILTLSLLLYSVPFVASAANVYATLDSANCNAGYTLSGGNLTAKHTAANSWISCKTTIGKSTGKWYWEMTATTKGVDDTIQPGVGTSTASLSAEWGSVGATSAFNSCGYLSQGFYECQNTETGGKATFTTTNVIGIAWDGDAKSVNFYKANVAQGAVTLTTDGSAMFGGLSDFDLNDQVTFNFGATAMTFTAPSGYNQGLFNTTASINHAAIFINAAKVTVMSLFWVVN